MDEGLDLTTMVLAGGKLPAEDSEVIRAALVRGVGKRIRVRIEECKNKRSDRQNRYYWGVVVKAWHRLIVSHGNIEASRQDVHDFLKQSVGKAFFFDRIMIDGKPTLIVKSSTRLDVKQWEDWMEACRALAAQHGVIIRLPNEND